MKNIYESQFHDLVSEIMSVDIDSDEFIKFQCVLGVVHAIVAQGKVDQLYKSLCFMFPEYYDCPQPFMHSDN